MKRKMEMKWMVRIFDLMTQVMTIECQKVYPIGEL
jgi:hypothetical protein